MQKASRTRGWLGLSPSHCLSSDHTVSDSSCHQPRQHSYPSNNQEEYVISLQNQRIRVVPASGAAFVKVVPFVPCP